ncbi:hypothetical protein ACHAXM_000474 [Skeletonema potamos]|jgi:hypothetical protein
MMGVPPLCGVQVMIFLLVAVLLLCAIRSVPAYSISRIKLRAAVFSSDALLEDTMMSSSAEATTSRASDTSYRDNLNHNKEQVNGLESSLLDFEAITKSDRAWLKKYNLLLAYYSEHHHTLIPVADSTLGRWVQRQRSYYKQGTLAESRIKALNKVKFVFDARNHNNQVPKVNKWQKRSWEERYSELRMYYDKYGHSNVPLKSGSLGGWVQYQRQCSDKLSTYQIDKLNEVDFIWNMKKHQWDQRFIELKEFIQTNGHSCIPSTPEYKALQAWCGAQRKLWKIKQSNSTIHCALTDEREERLSTINFDWQTSHEYVWQKRLQQLKAYKEENGHVNLSKSDGDLGVWVDTQRTEMRFKIDGHHTHLTDERIDELERLGFVWSMRDSEGRSEKYAALKEMERQPIPIAIVESSVIHS